MVTTFTKQLLSTMLSVLLLIGTVPLEVGAQTGQQGYSGQGVPLTADELQQLAAPIALYPDALVAQVLAAATFPDQVTAAASWLQYHSYLTGSTLMAAVDQQPWDPAIKALSQFPSVLANMATNLTWTSSLGEAYHTQAADMMAAIQVLRAKAYAAGNLKSVNATLRGATVAASDRDSTSESRRWFTFPCTTPQWSMAIPTWFQLTSRLPRLLPVPQSSRLELASRSGP